MHTWDGPAGDLDGMKTLNHIVRKSFPFQLSLNVKGKKS
jgi:hypothetical protein